MAQGSGLYSSDGRPGDLRQLALFSSGFQSDYDLQTSMVEAAGVVFFRLERDGGHRQLWRTDGKTAAGTYLLHDFGSSSPLSEPVAVAGKVYFAVDGAAEGRELWVSDGTVAGTRLLVDARPGPAGGDPREFRALTDRRFVFSYDDGIHGREPWISDGTAAGTRLLEDVRPGPASSDPRTFVPAPAAARLFFVANDPAGRPAPTYLKLEMPLACAAEKRCHSDGRAAAQAPRP